MMSRSKELTDYISKTLNNLRIWCEKVRDHKSLDLHSKGIIHRVGVLIINKRNEETEKHIFEIDLHPPEGPEVPLYEVELNFRGILLKLYQHTQETPLAAEDKTFKIVAYVTNIRELSTSLIWIPLETETKLSQNVLTPIKSFHSNLVKLQLYSCYKKD